MTIIYHDKMKKEVRENLIKKFELLESLHNIKQEDLKNKAIELNKKRIELENQSIKLEEQSYELKRTFEDELNEELYKEFENINKEEKISIDNIENTNIDLLDLVDTIVDKSHMLDIEKLKDEIDE